MSSTLPPQHNPPLPLPAQGMPLHAPDAPAHQELDDLPRNLKKPHFLTVIVVALLFLCLLAGLFAVGWFPHEKTIKRAKADAAEAADDTLTVAVTNPHRAVAEREVVLPATIRPNQDTLIYPRAAGYLKKIYVDIQDHVKEGQLLAEIDAPEVDAQLLQAKASVAQELANVTKADADLALTQRNLERLQSVKSEVTHQELDTSTTMRDQATAAVQQAKANVAAAQADVQRLETLQSFEKVTAPFDGTITARNFDVGALLTPNGSGTRELFRLQQSTTLRVFVSVPQAYATSINTALPVLLNVRNFPNRTFQGTVARTAASIDPNTRTMSFELRFPNPDGILVPGMFAEAHLALSSPPTALLVPVSAMLFNASGTSVALVTDGKIHFQHIAVDKDLGNELEVTSGLSLTDQIVVNPGERLTEGTPVSVAPQSPLATAKQ